MRSTENRHHNGIKKGAIGKEDFSVAQSATGSVA